VIVIGAEKETRCLVQRQKNEIKKMEDNTNTQEIRVAIASGPLDSCRIMYEEVFLQCIFHVGFQGLARPAPPSPQIPESPCHPFYEVLGSKAFQAQKVTILFLLVV